MTHGQTDGHTDQQQYSPPDHLIGGGGDNKTVNLKIALKSVKVRLTVPMLESSVVQLCLNTSGKALAAKKQHLGITQEETSNILEKYMSPL